MTHSFVIALVVDVDLGVDRGQFLLVTGQVERAFRVGELLVEQFVEH